MLILCEHFGSIQLVSTKLQKTKIENNVAVNFPVYPACSERYNGNQKMTSDMHRRRYTCESEQDEWKKSCNEE